MHQSLSKKPADVGKRQPGKLVAVNDRMPRGYRYRLVEPIGRNFDPEFKPELTPKEMLALRGAGQDYSVAIARARNA